MRLIRYSSFLFTMIGAALASIEAVTAFIVNIPTVLFAFVGDLFNEVFPMDHSIADHHSDTSDTEYVDRSSQTGNGVAAFITNLFSVEGRQYLWQAGHTA